MRRLPHPLNSYADPFVNGIVDEVNGVPVADLRALTSAFSKSRNGFHVVRFAGMKDLLVMEAAAMEQADAEILKLYQIPAAQFLGEEQ